VGGEWILFCSCFVCIDFHSIVIHLNDCRRQCRSGLAISNIDTLSFNWSAQPSQGFLILVEHSRHPVLVLFGLLSCHWDISTTFFSLLLSSMGNAALFIMMDTCKRHGWMDPYLIPCALNEGFKKSQHASCGRTLPEVINRWLVQWKYVNSCTTERTMTWLRRSQSSKTNKLEIEPPCQ
jgi:hypothetical protein